MLNPDVRKFKENMFYECDNFSLDVRHTVKPDKHRKQELWLKTFSLFVFSKINRDTAPVLYEFVRNLKFKV